MGLQGRQDAILNYVSLFARRAKEFAPLVKNGGLHGINLLKILFGVNNVEALKRKFPEMSSKSLSDETCLRKKGALKKILEEISEGRRGRPQRAKGDFGVANGKDGGQA